MSDIHEFHDEGKCCYGFQSVSGKILKNPILIVFHVVQCLVCLTLFPLYFLKNIKIDPVIYFIVDICLTCFYFIEVILLIFYWRSVCNFVVFEICCCFRSFFVISLIFLICLCWLYHLPLVYYVINTSVFFIGMIIY
jgi:hypothetical protein